MVSLAASAQIELQRADDTELAEAREIFGPDELLVGEGVRKIESRR